MDEDDSDAIEARILEDMTAQNFHATDATFDARPKPPVELAEGEFGTPPQTPPEIDDLTMIDPAEFRKALIELGVIELGATVGEPGRMV